MKRETRNTRKVWFLLILLWVKRFMSVNVKLHNITFFFYVGTVFFFFSVMLQNTQNVYGRKTQNQSYTLSLIQRVVTLYLTVNHILETGRKYGVSKMRKWFIIVSFLRYLLVDGEETLSAIVVFEHYTDICYAFTSSDSPFAAREEID